MATFHSNILELNKLMYSSHEKLIKTICRDLGQEEKADEFISKLLTPAFTKIKVPKNPDKPKKPLTTYMLFCNDNRSDVMKKNEGKSMGEISKILGEMWKKVSDSDKKKYQETNEKDKERYEEEMAEFNKNN